jgi:hypothetical protein
VHGTQHTTSTAPCAADHIFENYHRVVHRPARGQPGSSIVMRWRASCQFFTRRAHQSHGPRLTRAISQDRERVRGSENWSRRKFLSEPRMEQLEPGGSHGTRLLTDSSHRLERLEKLEQLVGTQGDSAVTHTIPHASESRSFGRNYTHVYNSALAPHSWNGPPCAAPMPLRTCACSLLGVMRAHGGRAPAPTMLILPDSLSPLLRAVLWTQLTRNHKITVIGIRGCHLKAYAISFNLAFLRRGKRIQHCNFIESRNDI